jgi:hypothetical protein
MPRVLSESSIVLTISFFTELKFKQRLCSKSTELPEAVKALRNCYQRKLFSKKSGKCIGNCNF